MNRSPEHGPRPQHETGQEHELPMGVQQAEEEAFLTIVDEAQAPEDGVNHGYYDIADHPIVTGEKPLHQKALIRAGQAGRAIVRYVSEADKSAGLQTWQPKQKDK